MTTQELPTATEITSKKAWIDGAVWKESGQTFAIREMENDALLVAKNKVLSWLGNHGVFLSRAFVDLEQAGLFMERCNAEVEAEQYFEALAFASRLAESVIDRQRKVASLQVVLEDLDLELNQRNVKTFSSIIALATMVTKHPDYQLVK